MIVLKTFEQREIVFGEEFKLEDGRTNLMICASSKVDVDSPEL